MNSEVEAEVCLAPGSAAFLHHVHPCRDYEVFVRDLVVTPGSDPSLLSMQIIFDAASLDEAEAQGEAHLKGPGESRGPVSSGTLCWIPACAEMA
jgi:hypothetical protein